MITRSIINAFRQMKRNLVSTVINILGLSLGLASSFIILLYVIGEYSYEKGQENRDQIFRVITTTTQDGRDLRYAINYGPLSSTVKQELPEVEKSCILEARVGRPFLVRTDKEYTIEKGSVYNTGPDYFDIFTVPLLRGNQASLLSDPNSIVLSKEMASKYFGDENPLGKSIYFQYDTEDIAYTVTGVMDRLKGKSAFTPDFIAKFDTQKNERFMTWNFVVYEVFIKVSLTTDINELEQKLNELGKKYHPDEERTYTLQNNKDFHLNSAEIYGSHLPKGNKSVILIFSSIGFLILLIACINYIILATAESTMRYKEIGMKKVVGADRLGIISQIQIESLLMSFLSLPIALLLVERSHEILGRIFGQELYFSYSGNWAFIVGFILITLIVGCISGSYISFHLSNLRPVNILAGKNPKKGSRSIVRKTLISFQLLIFVVLFSSASIIQKQIRYATGMNPDFDLENLIIIQDDQSRISNFEVLKTKLEAHPDIDRVSSSVSNLLLRNRFANFATSPHQPDKEVIAEQYHIDHDYLETLMIEPVKGNSFLGQETLSSKKVIINKQAAEELGYKDPIGKTLITKTIYNFEDTEYEIIGMVDDFISGTVKRSTGSFILFIRPPSIPGKSIAIRANSGLSDSGRAHLDRVWAEVTDDKPLEFEYMDVVFKNLYKQETTIAGVIIFFTILAIFISCLGLFGLSLFVARRKNKEIGIRKVFGAKPSDIVRLILKEFAPVIVIANILGLPITLMAMRKWLSVFAYKISPGAGIFIAALLLSAAIVGLTLTINSLKAASMNPAESLRDE